MPFIGNQPALSYTSFVKQDFTTSATTSYTLDNPVTNENEIALFINFVRQEPTTAYTASGTSLTLTSATSASDDMYCVFLGKAVQTVNPPNSSVGTSQLDSSLDFSSKTITLADNMKNTPAFLANRSGSTQSISNNTNTTVIFDNEVIDTDSGYDTSTGIYTVPSGKGGKYFICAAPTLTAASSATIFRAFVTKNGTSTVVARGDIRPGDAISYSNGFAENTPPCSAIVDLSAGDTLRVIVRFEGGNGNERISNSSSGAASQFFGYKLI